MALTRSGNKQTLSQVTSPNCSGKPVLKMGRRAECCHAPTVSANVMVRSPELNTMTVTVDAHNCLLHTCNICHTGSKDRIFLQLHDQTARHCFRFWIKNSYNVSTQVLKTLNMSTTIYRNLSTQLVTLYIHVYIHEYRALPC